MNRKSLFWLLTTVLLTTAPIVQAQQPTKIPRIGCLSSTVSSANADRHDAFRQGRRELG